MHDRHLLMTPVTALALGAAALPALAAINWQYLDGYDVNGIPNTLVQETVSPTLLSAILARLPEGLDINQNKDEKRFLTDNLGANIHLVQDSEITVVALGGQTDFINSVGFFSYPTDKAPTSTAGLNHRIVFPNFPATAMAGARGNAVKLGRFKAGTSVGFFVAANGWQQGQVNPNQAADQVYYTIRDLNPETPSSDGNSHLNAHTVLLSSAADNLLVLGFEDAFRHPSNQDKTKPQRSDDDFNDVLLAIHVSPLSNADLSGVTTLDPVPQDSDGDGITDDLDAFPLDPNRAARRFYPNATGYGALAFEDLWPKKGDFDMNDLVVAYRAVETLNAQNQIVDLQLNYEIRARGAGADNAFGVHLPGVSATAVDPAGTSLTINNQVPVALPVESGQTDAVFIISPNVTPLTSTGQAFPCSMMNTVMKCARSAPVPLVANIHFKTPLDKAQLGYAPYNPFIYRTGKRGLEIHLVDHPPTAKADPRLFNTLDDASNPSLGRYYRTAANEPWALDIPETWRWPTEWNNIRGAYPDFVTWVGSSGTAATGWYVGQTVLPLIFQP